MGNEFVLIHVSIFMAVSGSLRSGKVLLFEVELPANMMFLKVMVMVLAVCDVWLLEWLPLRFAPALTPTATGAETVNPAEILFALVLAPLTLSVTATVSGNKPVLIPCSLVDIR